MILNFFVLLTLLQFGLSYPDPNVEVGVNVRVDNDGNNCCKRDCNFGGVSYQHECHLKDTCIKMQCIDGTWEYKGFKEDCGNCAFGEEPVVFPFDHLTSSQSPYPGSLLGTYWTGDNGDVQGEYVMSQPNFNVPAEFYVNVHIIDDCPHGGYCVGGVTYHELGITINMILPPTSNSLGEIKVEVVNEGTVTITDKVEYLYGSGGAILAFKHKHILTALNVNCISIVGTKGFTVALCEREPDGLNDSGYPWAYVLADKSLQHTIQGLCNTWTGVATDCFTEQTGPPCVKDWWTGNNIDNSFGMKANLISSWKFP